MRKNRHSRISKDKRKFKINKDSFKRIIYVITVLLLIFIVSLINKQSFNHELISLNNSKNSDTVNNNVNYENTVSTSSEDVIDTNSGNTTINLSIVGDIMCHNTQYIDAYNTSNNTYDFSYVFNDIKYYLQTADLSIGNLETTFSSPKYPYSGYPTFNTPESLAKNLKDVGIDIVSTANNHCYDKGYYGIENTISYLDKANISHMGTYTSKEDQNTILIKNVKGIKIAFLSFTYGTNGISIPQDKEFSVNLINETNILNQINLAKEQSPDIICVNMHWGTEYQTVKNSSQENWTNFLLKNGVDIILGSHPHVLQSMEIKNVTLDDGTSKNAFVIYSLGNFMSAQTKDGTKDSIILKLQLTKNTSTNKVSIDTANYVPIYMYKSKSSSDSFKVLDIENSILKYQAGENNIDQSTYNTLKSELTKIKSTMGDNIINTQNIN